MCSPTIALVAASTAFSAYGSVKQGQAQKSAADFNAAQGETQALDALERGNTEEARYRREIAQVAGSQRAAFGARNVKVEGTAVDLLDDTALLGEQDALTIRKNARTTAAGLYGQAAETRREGSAAKRAGLFNAGSTLLTGGASAYGYYKRGL